MTHELAEYRPTDRDTFTILPQATALAREIAGTDFVPVGLRNKPAAVLAAILAGREVGLGPMQSLSQIAVIEGRPNLSAHGARALVQGHGHEIWPDPEPTISRCVMHLRRRGEQNVYTATWTIDDAKRAGLAGKQNWQRYPKNMLLARATGDVCRLGAADVLGGMPYLREEIEDGEMGTASLPESTNGAALAEPPEEPIRHRRRRSDPTPPPPPPPDTDDQAAPAGALTFNQKQLDPEPPESQGATETPLPAPSEAPPATAPPATPAPASNPQGQLAGEAHDGRHLTLAQQIAMLARELEIERSVIIEVVTGKASASQVTREEAMRVIEALRGIRNGTQRLVQLSDNQGWVLNETTPPPPATSDELPFATE